MRIHLGSFGTKGPLKKVDIPEFAMRTALSFIEAPGVASSTLKYVIVWAEIEYMKAYHLVALEVISSGHSKSRRSMTEERAEEISRAYTGWSN